MQVAQRRADQHVQAPVIGFVSSENIHVCRFHHKRHEQQILRAESNGNKLDDVKTETKLKTAWNSWSPRKLYTRTTTYETTSIATVEVINANYNHVVLNTIPRLNQ